MKLPELLKERLQSVLLTAIGSGLGFVLLSIAKETAKPFADHVVPAIGASNLLWLSLLLFVMVLILGAWVCILIFGDRQKRLMKQYEFVVERSYYRHLKTKQLVCGSCLIAGIESPLATGYSNQTPVFQCCRLECSMLYARD